MNTTPDRPDLARQILVLAGDLAKLTKDVKSAAEAADLHASGADSRFRRIETSLKDQADLSEQIRELREAIDDLSASAAEPTVWDWTTMDAEEAGGTWAALVDWVNDVAGLQLGLVGFARKGERNTRLTRLPLCWALHRDVIWIASWLCQEWLRVWQTSAGTAAKAGDWYTRLWPGALARINASSASECLSGCEMLEGDGWGFEGDTLEAVSASYRAELADELRRSAAEGLRTRGQAAARQAPVVPVSPRARAAAAQSPVVTGQQYRSPTPRVEPRDFTR